MDCDILEKILIEKTSSEKHILKLLNSSSNKKLNNEDIMSILYPVLNWDIEGDVVILKGESLMPADENITISKHHRFIPIPKHKHDFIELSYVYKGSLTQSINGETITLREGEMCILDMNIEHSINAS
ncbi:MAG: AraC family ligand binding domain-containing protein, partial [Peptostreptococcaceae bacterium]